MADEEADPQPGQPVGLGEGTQDGRVRAVAVELQAVGHVRVAHVLGVRLVQHHQAVRWHTVEEVLEFRAVHHGSRRVVRVADEDHPGPGGDRGRHLVQVVRLVPERHQQLGRAGQLDQPRVGLERAPRVQHLTAGLGDGLQQLLGDAHRAASHRDVRGRDAVAPRDRLGQRDRPVVRVPVDVRGCLRDDLHHRGERAVRGLVGRQLEGAAVRPFHPPARLVGDELIQDAAEAWR